MKDLENYLKGLKKALKDGSITVNEYCDFYYAAHNKKKTI